MHLLFPVRRAIERLAEMGCGWLDGYIYALTVSRSSRLACGTVLDVASESCGGFLSVREALGDQLDKFGGFVVVPAARNLVIDCGWRNTSKESSHKAVLNLVWDILNVVVQPSDLETCECYLGRSDLLISATETSE
ncbi:hypothetical protein AG1IA_07497 [Rhizoctonia solani AG-1 IA]|uniref:Uncharacterized protein n=1 Tax=Thanatephorus cucumeris (strain AG1-IA) TaxID=983506 RepID=L8WQ63_THACA|nr:hypothetical protein AG1IA_07497 [Rhizoctonia solani AG-1 IA]